MSKSLKNYPDPSNVINEFGSDALRLYLINSPVVRAEPLRFKEAGVKEVVSKVLLPLWNSYRFFCEQAILFEKNNGKAFAADPSFTEGKSLENVMDKWILADCQSMLQFINQEMSGYRLYTVVPRLLNVLDNLTNWYIRFNRKRLKGVAGLGLDDTKAALNTLLQVLFTLVRALAPFTPFITEHIYGLLKPYLAEVTKEFKDARSVHFLPFPTVQEALFDAEIERKVASMQKVILLGRTARERRTISLKTPLKSIVVVSDEQHLSDIESLQTYVKGELNVQDVVLSSDEAKYSIILEAKVDWPTLGKKLKKEVQKVRKALPTLKQEQLRQYQTDKTMNVDGIVLEENDLEIVRVLAKTEGESTEQPKLEPAFSNDVIILLDTDVSDEDLVFEGLAREMINRVQKLRKKANLVPTDDVHMQYSVLANPESVNIDGVLESKDELFVNALRGKLEPLADSSSGDKLIAEEEQSIGELRLMLRLARI